MKTRDNEMLIFRYAIIHVDNEIDMPCWNFNCIHCIFCDEECLISGYFINAVFGKCINDKLRIQ